MTEEEIKKQNPWLQYPYVSRLYDKNTNMIHPDDRAIVDDYNQNRPSDFEVHTPPFPFQGDPFRSKVVFLSLNPGFVERLNIDAALLLEQVKDLRIQLSEEWNKHRIHDVNSFFPNPKDVNLYQGYQLLGDWYWYDKLKHLLKHLCDDAKMNEIEFFQKVALIQLMPYSSTFCNKVITNLPTQKYTKNLIDYLLKQPKGPLFVVMRSEPDWGELLGIKDFQDAKYKDRFVIRKRDKNGNRPRLQYINQNAFEDNGYERIIQAIKS